MKNSGIPINWKVHCIQGNIHEMNQKYKEPNPYTSSWNPKRLMEFYNPKNESKAPRYAFD